MGERTKCLTVAELERVNRVSALKAERVASRVALALDLAGDGQREKRVAARQCRGCFYLDSGLAGQAFTKWTCGLCGKEDMHHNTNTPKLCMECSQAFDLCAMCGGDIEMRCRTKRFGRKANRIVGTSLKRGEVADD